MSIEFFSTVSVEELQTVLDNKLFRDVLDTLPNGVQVLKAVRNRNKQITDFIYIFVNKAAEVYTGKIIEGETLLTSFSHLPGDYFFEKLINTVNNNITEDFVHHYALDGINEWLHYVVKKFGDGVLIIHENITAQKQSEELIKQLNKNLVTQNRELETVNSELRTFSSVAANDYKETLKHLYTLLEFIATNDARNFSNAGKANLRRAQSSIQKLKLLTDDILSYSEIHPAETNIAIIDLNDVLKTVLQKLNRKIEETNATIQSDTLPKVNGYTNLLSLLFYHLIDNAIKFRKEKTAPFIQIRHSQVNGMHINHADADPALTYHVISITDNGTGIEKVHTEKIFQMFYIAHERNKYKGSGIGLAICKKVMDIHEGFIAAEATPENKGTTFNCFFPLRGGRFNIHRKNTI